MTCPDEALTRYALGESPPDEAAAVRRHLDTCETCRAEAANRAAAAALLRTTYAAAAPRAPHRLDPAHRRFRAPAEWRTALFAPTTRWPRWLEIAALFAVLLAFAGLLLPATGSVRERGRRVGAANQAKMAELAKLMEQEAADSKGPSPASAIPSSGGVPAGRGGSLDLSAAPLASAAATPATPSRFTLSPPPPTAPSAPHGATRAHWGLAASGRETDQLGDYGFQAGAYRAHTTRGLAKDLEKASPADARNAELSARRSAETLARDKARRVGGVRHRDLAMADRDRDGLRDDWAGKEGVQQQADAAAELQAVDATANFGSLGTIAKRDALQAGLAKTKAPAKQSAAQTQHVYGGRQLARAESSLRSDASDTDASGLEVRERLYSQQSTIAGKPVSLGTGVGGGGTAATAVQPQGGSAGAQITSLNVVGYNGADKESLALAQAGEANAHATLRPQAAASTAPVAPPPAATAFYDEQVAEQPVQQTAAQTVAEPTPVVQVAATAQAMAMAPQEAVPPTPPPFDVKDIQPWRATSEKPLSTFSLDVDTASYTLCRNYILRGIKPPPGSVRVEEFVNAFDDGYTPPTRSAFAVQVEGAPSPFRPSVHLLKIGVTARKAGREDRPSVLTVVVDTSGSMALPDRLPLVQQALRMLADGLEPNDRLALVAFSEQPRLVLDPTPARNKKALHRAIDRLQAAGLTDLEAGLRLGYQTAARAFVPGAGNRVLLLSDGVANLGAGAAADILASVDAYRKQGILLSVFGFGLGVYDDRMLATLAAKGDGNYRYIDSADEARRAFVDDLTATLRTMAGDVKIQVEFNPRRVAQYRQLGYDTRQLRDEDFRNDAVDAGEAGSGQSATCLYEARLTGDEREPIATVRVRYRDLENHRIEEIAQPIGAKALVPAADQADLRFRLAACAAEFAEVLRGSPFVAGSSYADVARWLRPVALDLNVDTRVQEFLRLVNAAPGLAEKTE